MRILREATKSMRFLRIRPAIPASIFMALLFFTPAWSAQPAEKKTGNPPEVTTDAPTASQAHPAGGGCREGKRRLQFYKQPATTLTTRRSNRGDPKGITRLQSEHRSGLGKDEEHSPGQTNPFLAPGAAAVVERKAAQDKRVDEGAHGRGPGVFLRRSIAWPVITARGVKHEMRRQPRVPRNRFGIRSCRCSPPWNPLRPRCDCNGKNCWDVQSSLSFEVSNCDTMLTQIAEAQQTAVGGLFQRDGHRIWDTALWDGSRTSVPRPGE